MFLQGTPFTSLTVDAEHMRRYSELGGSTHMLVTTTPTIEGKKIVAYLGVVSGEAVLGANVIKDFFASITDIAGGRAAAYEGELRRGVEIAVEEMKHNAILLGAIAVVGVDLDYETILDGSMLMVSASGTAVVYK
jgi:uncharacterized protein YbjQ (UPF0145 family)